MKQEKDPHPPFWHDRGYLPHYEGGTLTQFITFRLADSLPVSLFKKLRKWLESGRVSESEYAYLLDRYLGGSKGECYLRQFEVGSLVVNSIRFLDGKRYRLHSWVIMPNHVHLLLSPAPEESLQKIMHSIKSYTAHEANKLLRREGEFWSKEYFDRYMRDQDHFNKTVRYIEMNPVKAGLCRSPDEWRFSSAYGSRP